MSAIYFNIQREYIYILQPVYIIANICSGLQYLHTCTCLFFSTGHQKHATAFHKLLYQESTENKGMCAPYILFTPLWVFRAILKSEVGVRAYTSIEQSQCQYSKLQGFHSHYWGDLCTASSAASFEKSTSMNVVVMVSFVPACLKESLWIAVYLQL